ncbi:serine/threonine-protein kinase fray2-like [Saccostrea cucullata]|uniref:serine/threonine-protein kinase fray2-like n=1 Tax=Saccostrea cuccullata TaxID=36930 RepID=UPI002ED4EA3B
MSHSAPWSYQQQNTDPGGVKLFNPAQFSEQTNGPSQFDPAQQQTNGPSQFDPAQQDANTGHQQEAFNGQPENYNMGHDPSWNWNYAQQDPSQFGQNPNMYGHQGQMYYDHNQGQWVFYEQYDQTHGYDPSQGNMQPEQQFNGSNIETPSGNFPQNYNEYGGNYTGYEYSENMGTNSHPLSDGQHHEQNTDQSVDSEKLDQSSTSQGMSGFFQNDDYDTESNTGTYDSSFQESSLQNSLNQMQEEKHAGDVIKPEISGESLQTLNYSTGSLDTAANAVSTPSVQQVTDQMQEMSMSTQGQFEDLKESETNTQHPPEGNDLNQSAIHGQVNSTGNVSENVSGGSPHSDDQHGLSDWEVVPPESSQMLEVPGGETKHSREGSLDNNVQFFIGSGKNSDDGSARHTPESSQQGQNNTHLEQEKENTVDNLQLTTEHLQPQLTSSPNVSPGQNKIEDEAGNKPPPPAGPPPSGALSENNPFRKDKANASKKADTKAQSISQPFSRSDNPQMPSPIVASSEDSMRAAQKTQPQSPIMPRKESPFQPPNRRRTLSSQSSESEDQPKSEKEVKASSPSIPSQISSSRESLTSPSSKQGQENEKFKRPPRDTTKSRPPMGSTRGVMSPRRIESAFQQVQKQRAKHNMSPATTLWANNDTLPVANILLAPAAPAITPILTPASSTTSSTKTSPSKTTKDSRDVLSPVQMLINSMSEKQTDKPAADSKQGSKQYDNRQERPHQRGSERDRHERGSSIDRELEITRRMEDKERRRESEGYRDRDRDNYKSDRSRGKERDYDPYYDRQPPSRRRDPYYGDERYDRPRSRHSLLDDDGSSSKGGQESDRPRSRHDYNRDTDRPRSRQDYGRDQYYRDKYGRGQYTTYTLDRGK